MVTTEEYLARRKDKLAYANQQAEMLRQQQFLQLSDTPEQLPDIYENVLKQGKDPFADFRNMPGLTSGNYKKNAAPMPEYTEVDKVEQWQATRRNDWVVAYEEAFARHRGEIPYEWWMQWDPADLRLVGGSELASVAEDLESRQYNWAIERQKDRELEAQATAEAESRARGRELGVKLVNFVKNPVGNLLGTADNIPIPEGGYYSEEERDRILEELRTARAGQRDKLFEEDIKSWREKTYLQLTRLGEVQQSLEAAGDFQVSPEEKLQSEKDIQTFLDEQEAAMRGQLREGADPGKLMGTQALAQVFLEGGMEALGWTVDKVSRGVGLSLAIADGITPNVYGDGVHARLKDEADKRKEEMIAELEGNSADVEQLTQDVSEPMLRSLWADMDNTRPDIKEEYMRIAGFDPLLAFSMFKDDQQQNDVVKDALADYVNQMTEADKERIADLRENDFRVSDVLLEKLSWYGNWVNTVGTTFLALTTVDDIWDNFSVDTYDKFLTDVKQVVHEGGDTPSSFLGIDGSLAGLALDLGMGIAFDPTTYLFGPRGALRTVKAYTVAEVKNLATHPMVAQFMADAVLSAQSPVRGAAALMHHLGWLDQPGRAEFLAEIGYTPKLVQKTSWRFGEDRALGMDVKVDFLRRVAGDTKPAFPKNLGRDMLKDTKEVLTVEVSRATGEIRLLDGHKRLAAAEDVGLTHLPVKLEIVDDFAAKNIFAQNLEEMLAKDELSTYRPLDEYGEGPVTSRPDLLIPRDALLGKMPMEKLREIATNAIMRGAVPDGAKRSLIAVGWNKHIRDKLNTQPMGGWIQRYMSPMNIITRYELVGPGAIERIYDSMWRMWGDDASKANQWAEALMDIERRAAQTQQHAVESMQALAPVRRQLQQLRKDFNPELWDARLTEARNLLDNTPMDPARAKKIADRVAELDKRIDDLESADTLSVDDYRAMGDPNPEATATAAWEQKFEELDALVSERHDWIQEQKAQVGDVAEHQRLLDRTGITDEAQYQVELGKRQAYAKELRLKQKEFNALYTKMHRMRRRTVGTDEIAQLMKDMWEDYNRTYIGTNPFWKKFADETGFVDWEHLKKGKAGEATVVREGVAEGPRHFLPETMRELSGDAEMWAKKLMNSLNMEMAIHVPLSNLEMVMAREIGGAGWTRATHFGLVSKLRETSFMFHTIWVMDKVFRGSTAITVSFDELLRMWHLGGPEAVLRWMNDRAIYTKARAEALIHEGALRQGVAKGGKYLSPKSQERIRALQDSQTYLKQAERQFYDGNGLGWVDIGRKDPQFYEAARRWTGGMMQDSGFRAFLRGKEAFQEWFFSPDGERLRNSSVMARHETGSWGSRTIKGADEAYDGWKMLFEDVIYKGAKDSGDLERVMAAFKDTAKRIDDAGGRAFELPDWVHDHLESVRGVRKHMPTKYGATALTERFFDNFFMNPVNYRRGFLSEMVRKTERSRIESLMASQRKEILPDLAIEKALGLEGMAGSVGFGMKGVFQDMALKAGYMPESLVNDIIERAVQREVDNVLFTWDKGSRMGVQGKALFPFGKPWADMVGFWGREVLRKPTMRGWINETNFLGLKNLERLPLNPKPAAMMSRLAATDFTIDHGVLGGALGTERKEGGLLPGSQSSDLSPIFFLPTGGDNPFAAIIPGLGYVPLQFMDMVLNKLKDPVNDPQGYAELLGNISDFLPMFRFQQGGFISRLAGGGSIGSVASMMTDAVGMYNAKATSRPSSWYGLTSNLGDLTREVNRTRHISAILAYMGTEGDPEDNSTLEDLMNAGSQEELDLLLHGIAVEADKAASGSHLAQALTRWVVPSNNKFDTAISDILDVWVQAADIFPDLAPGFDLGTSDENARKYADKVRRSFFQLPQWKRDAYVAKFPQLAVNLVGSWEWTDAAVSAELPDSDKSYRTGGTAEDLARHQYYIENGYVRPLNPMERMRRIVGMMQASRESAAKSMYEYSASAVNNALWEKVVSPGVKKMLDDMAASSWGRKKGLEDGRELWSSWGSLESDFEKWYAGEHGIEAGTEEFDNLKSLVKVPTKERAWGATWPGLNDEEVSQRFREVEFNALPAEVKELAALLGVQVTPGMNGLQLFSKVQEYITHVDSPLYSTVRLSYDQYVSERAQPKETTLRTLTQAAFNPDFSESWRQQVKDFLYMSDHTSEKYRKEIGGIPLEEQEKVAQAYFNLRVSNPDLRVNWDKLWDDGYANTYGPQDWVMPLPRSPYDDQGKIIADAQTPYIRTVVDGDTLIVKEKRDSAEYMSVRLLGVRAADYGLDDEGADNDKDRLEGAILEAQAKGDTIWLVRDPHQIGSNTDMYGRVLAWLWIGDEPFYFPEDFRRTDAPARES